MAGAATPAADSSVDDAGDDVGDSTACGGGLGLRFPRLVVFDLLASSDASALLPGGKNKPNFTNTPPTQQTTNRMNTVVAPHISKMLF